eukprot:GHVT01064589.1.p1 GENE.GHVT01064589.1~~GHVT01064589.1.p1  ORF type:complete len:308 (+),score=78.15 GHVT01064589.1:668-1591(+)
MGKNSLACGASSFLALRAVGASRRRDATADRIGTCTPGRKCSCCTSLATAAASSIAAAATSIATATAATPIATATASTPTATAATSIATATAAATSPATTAAGASASTSTFTVCGAALVPVPSRPCVCVCVCVCVARAGTARGIAAAAGGRSGRLFAGGARAALELLASHVTIAAVDGPQVVSQDSRGVPRRLWKFPLLQRFHPHVFDFEHLLRRMEAAKLLGAALRWDAQQIRAGRRESATALATLRAINKKLKVRSAAVIGAATGLSLRLLSLRSLRSSFKSAPPLTRRAVPAGPRRRFPHRRGA